MAVEYDYTKSPVDIDSLVLQIENSNIRVALDHVSTYQSALSVFFKDYLTSGDEVTLNNIVAAHTGVPYPSLQAQPVSVQNTLTTQFERQDIVLKMARIKVPVSNVSGVGKGSFKLKVPGNFGTDDGRYLAGGYAMIDTFDVDDVLKVWVEDQDRIICAAMGLATDGSDDATVQGMGVLPGALSGFGALPNYPIIETYTDEGLPVDNQGWYFYPEALGNNLPPQGYIDVEPLGFYGHPPSGLYIVFDVERPNVTSGTLRGNIFWGISAVGQ